MTNGNFFYGLQDSPLKELVPDLCQTYSIDPLWLKAIVTTESQWNVGTMRFETTYAYLYEPSQFINAWNTINTEICNQKMSWGYGQIMGALAREQGLTGFMSQLLDPAINLKHLCIRLQFLKKHYSEKDTDVFSMYNAGPNGIRKNNGVYLNQTYVDKVVNNIKLFV